MTKHLLREAFLFSVPVSILVTGLAMAHTGTGVLLLGATLYVGNKLDNLRSELYDGTKDGTEETAPLIHN